MAFATRAEGTSAVANDLVQLFTNEPDFLKKVITRDESWIYGCGPETKAQAFQWKLPGSPCLKKAWQSHSKIKTMSTVFFDWEGVVQIKYAAPDQTVNKEHYLNVLH